MRLIVAAVLIYIGIMQFVAMTQGGNALFSILFGLLFIGVGGWFVFYAFKSFRRDKDEKGSGETACNYDMVILQIDYEGRKL